MFNYLSFEYRNDLRLNITDLFAVDLWLIKNDY
jgi:hypothetical protein